MSWLDDAIEDGMRQGFENTAYKHCDGKDDPDSRCPNETHECVCAYLHWCSLPWWRRIFSECPPRPSREAAMRTAIRALVESEAEKSGHFKRKSA